MIQNAVPVGSHAAYVLTAVANIPGLDPHDQGWLGYPTREDRSAACYEFEYEHAIKPWAVIIRQQSLTHDPDWRLAHLPA